MGSVPAIQLAHAGRKGSAKQPWKGGAPLEPKKVKKTNEKPWKTFAPSAIALGNGWQIPKAMSLKDITNLINSYVKAALRAVSIGFEIIEIHAAHGYLLHSFLSPISNKRIDDYGGNYDGRIKLLKDIIIEIRKKIPLKFLFSVEYQL